MTSARRRRDAVVGGLVGTAVMTASLALESRLRPHGDGPVDYDASDHVVIAAAKVTRWNPRTPAGRRVLFNLVHWGYGSVVAVEYEQFRRALGGSDAAASAAFYASCQGMAFTLFPLLGDTPPPWRWRRSLLASSIGQHALYVVTVSAVSRRLSARSRSSRAV
ncbi:MAG TPA: hypothetical protein VGN18_15840 [Jatrophihabitans sp.]|uniref:hypothetical protein n=1 Tax=Jatrophihabitans sp. TaxID=1932789 RepID=UPI002DF7D022|nr:hypothetical protein [Jatrophihabitans sp.]